MGEHRQGRRSQVGTGALSTRSLPAVVRVRPDVAAIDRAFDYRVPDGWKQASRDYDLRVGGRVRIELHGRRVGGWITELDPSSPADVELLPLRKWSGHGPTPEMIGLCDWAADYWFGRPARFLRTASPTRNVYRLGRPAMARYDGSTESWADQAFEGPGSVTLVAPASDRWPLVLSAARLGNPLLLMPTIEAAQALAARVRRAGLQAAVLPEDWDRAASGAVVIGTRAAAFAPTYQLGSIMVFDEHDDAYHEERAPTWHARAVAIERAKRAGVPCVLVSPTPSVEAIRSLPLREPDRVIEHAGWPMVEPVDRRDEPPGRLGLFSERVARALHGSQRVACVLNRTGRVRLLACVACGALAACERCGGAVSQPDDSLVCVRCDERRPPVCASCGSARLKNLVLGIGRAREELEALIGEPVGEHTAAGVDQGDARVVIGTEALLRDTPPRGHRFGTVVFLDFDQHLTATRQQAEAEAMHLLALAARQVGARRGGGRIIVQTRLPDHRVLRAAIEGHTAPQTRALGEQADAMRWPPAVAQAEVSGPGAAGFIERFGHPLGVTVLGPRDDTWLLRADDRALLLAELSRPDRGDERLRIAIA